jgi:hypothetical protein
MREPIQRRLASIFAADVAGYSRLMGADEEGTLERLKAHRPRAYRPKNQGTPRPHCQDHRRRHAGGFPERCRCGALRCRGAAGNGRPQCRCARGQAHYIPNRGQESTLLSHSDQGQPRAASGQSETNVTTEPWSAIEWIADADLTRASMYWDSNQRKNLSLTFIGALVDEYAGSSLGLCRPQNALPIAPLGRSSDRREGYRRNGHAEYARTAPIRRRRCLGLAQRYTGTRRHNCNCRTSLR